MQGHEKSRKSVFDLEVSNTTHEQTAGDVSSFSRVVACGRSFVVDVLPARATRLKHAKQTRR